MGKRFGRNQRRRLRQQVDQATEALVMAHGLMTKLRHDRDELRAVLDDVEQALGPNFIGLRPRELAMRATDLALDDRFRVTSPSNRVVDMALMRVDSHARHADNLMHLRVRLDGQAAIYAISRNALLIAPAAFLATQLAREMAPLLLDEIRKAGGR